MLVQELDHMSLVGHGNGPLDVPSVGKEAGGRVDGHVDQKLRVNAVWDVVLDVRIRGFRVSV